MVITKKTILPLLISAITPLFFLIPINVVLEKKMLLLERLFDGGGFVQIALLTFYSVFVTYQVLTKDKMAKIRSIYWQMFTVVFFVQLFLGVAFSSLFLMTGKLHFPIPAVLISGALFRGNINFMVFLFVGTILLSGPAWCSHLCYFGGVDDLFAKMKRRPIDAKPISSWYRYGMLGVAIVIPLLFRFFEVPIIVVLLTVVAYGVGSLLVVFFLSRTQGKMVHCTAYCPLGAVTSLLSKVYPVRLKVDTHSCTSCGVCSTTCRYGALTPLDLSKGSAGYNCTLCGDCLDSCNHGSLRVSFWNSKSDLWPYYIAFVIGLQSVFLGMARI